MMRVGKFSKEFIDNVALAFRTANELTEENEQSKARIASLESELAAARQSARTPGTVEVCEECHQERLVWGRNGEPERVWETCSNDVCPIRAASEKAQEQT